MLLGVAPAVLFRQVHGHTSARPRGMMETLDRVAIRHHATNDGVTAS